jgi:hypothetical protein
MDTFLSSVCAGDSCTPSDLGLSIPDGGWIWFVAVIAVSALIAWTVYRCFRAHSQWLDALNTRVKNERLQHRHLWIALHALTGLLMIVLVCSSVCGYLKFIEVFPNDVGCLMPDRMIYEAFSDYVTVTSIIQFVLWLVRKTTGRTGKDGHPPSVNVKSKRV